MSDPEMQMYPWKERFMSEKDLPQIWLNGESLEARPEKVSPISSQVRLVDLGDKEVRWD